MKKVIFAGSFDPFTLGHKDIVKRALKVFDHLTILVANSPDKKTMFSSLERKMMLEKLYEGQDQVMIALWDGLVVDYAKENKISFLVRGVRNQQDFTMEQGLAFMNERLSSSIQTIFIPTDKSLMDISSSYARELLNYGASLKGILPELIINLIVQKNEE